MEIEPGGALVFIIDSFYAHRVLFISLFFDTKTAP